MSLLKVDYEVTSNVREIKKGPAETNLDRSIQLQDVSFQKVFSRHKLKVNRETSVKEKTSSDLVSKANKEKVKSKKYFDPDSLNLQALNSFNSSLSSEMLKKLGYGFNHYREQQNSVQRVDGNYATEDTLSINSNDVLKNLTAKLQQVFSRFDLIESQQTVSGNDYYNKDGFFLSKLSDQENSSNIQTLLKDYIKLLNKQFSNLTLSDGKTIKSLETDVLKTGDSKAVSRNYFMFADSKIRRDFGISFDYLRSMIADLDKQSFSEITSAGTRKNSDFTSQIDDFHGSRTKGSVKQILVPLHAYNSTLENETPTSREFRAVIHSPERVADGQGSRVLSEITDVANLSNVKVVDLKDSANVGTTYVEKFAHLKSTIGPELIRHSSILIRDGGGEIKLLLRPESMGNVRINITIENGSLEGKIMVENTIVRDLIENNLPSLRNSLKSEGFNTLSLDVSLGNDKNKSELPNENQEMTEVTYEFDSDDKPGFETGFFTDQVIDLVV